MVDRMVQADLDKTHGRKLDQDGTSNELGQLLAAELFYRSQVLTKHRIKPGGNLGGVADGVRPRDRTEVKGSGTNAAQETLFSGNNMPGQLQGTLGNGIRAIIAFIQRNSFNHLLGDAVLGLERR